MNPQALRIEPCLMGWLAAMPQRCPLARVAVLCRAYMVDPKHYVRCGHVFLARGLAESQVKAASQAENNKELLSDQYIKMELAKSLAKNTKMYFSGQDSALGGVLNGLLNVGGGQKGK